MQEVIEEVVPAEQGPHDTATINIGTDDNQTENMIPVTKEEHEKLHKATVKGDWKEAESIIRNKKHAVELEMSKDGSTILHLAVGIGHNEFVENLLWNIKDGDLCKRRRSSDGSTALHIAAIVGNRYAAHLLLEKSKDLLRIKDHKGHVAWHKAYENMHLDTLVYLFKASGPVAITRALSLPSRLQNRSLTSQDTTHPQLHPNTEIGDDLLVSFISAHEFNLASELIKDFPEFAVKTDGVLMALAKSFPSGLNHWETLIYPSLDGIWEALENASIIFFGSFLIIPIVIRSFFVVEEDPLPKWSILMVIPCFVGGLIYFLISVVYYIYYLLWKASSVIVAPIKHIEKKKKEWEEAENVLNLVCNEIDKLEYCGTHHPYYTGPILEAARQNVYKVVDEILFRSPEAIRCTDKNGYDIIILAVLHRSYKVYNLIYDIGERKNLYRTFVDSSKNNIVHLVGKLAPSDELSRRTGAALQLQRELQWHEEVKKLVFPTYITQENIFKETPDMVFTREHENLLKEGEKWMKTTSESCSITAVLITTIVFAAAITVPGGSSETTGAPLFRKDVGFTIFAISDAISLFASTTALLVFLSILTARFAENDFLVSLPRRLLIGICALLISTTAMMVAFSATLFLVFSDQKPWMLGPICGLAFIPIFTFVTLQFPLIADLFRSTHLPIFGKQRKSAYTRFNADTVRLCFDMYRKA
uniref:PGG domain-containing protein n=2 Tax=Lactuca sativa TaxID=4236 RepID=A0A9R1UZP8_LACSA|nr:hypothetical protein LSAT_V11C700361950 [Lactuca sativa]